MFNFRKFQKIHFSWLWTIIWIVAMVITVKMVQQNIAEYLTYPAFLSQRSDNEGYVFPKIGLPVPDRPLIPKIQDSKG